MPRPKSVFYYEIRNRNQNFPFMYFVSEAFVIRVGGTVKLVEVSILTIESHDKPVQVHSSLETFM